MSRQRLTLKSILLIGILGCILMAGSDYLMIYGDTAYHGTLAWLTVGVAGIAPWRNSLAMALAFPAVFCYAIALLHMKELLVGKKAKNTYTFLTAFGFTPWLCLHLFYIMILYLFSWMTGNGYGELAYTACEALFHHLSWVVIAGQVIMLLPFLYWLVAAARRKTVFSRWMAINNPLIIYVVLKLFSGILPDVPFRLAFINGLMSESMAIWFLILLIALPKNNSHCVVPA